MRKRLGFTLAELLIVVAIVSVLVSISIPVFSSKLDKAKEVTCLANRRSLYALMTSGYISGEYDSLEEAFDKVYDAHKTEFVCPSYNGHHDDYDAFYWVDDGNGGGHIACKYHDGDDPGGDDPGDDPGGDDPGGDPGSTYPGTSITITSNYWPEQSDYVDPYGNLTVNPGGIFKYTDGNYYIVNKVVSLTKSQAATGPGGDAWSWYATQKITGTIVTYSSDSEQKSTLIRGDICKAGDDYYVFVDGGNWAYGPTVQPNSWYKIPS